MNRIFTLFLGLLILSLQACTNNQTNTQTQYPTRTKTDLEKMGLHGKVKSLNIKSYSLDPKTGKTKDRSNEDSHTNKIISTIEDLHLDIIDVFFLNEPITQADFNEHGNLTYSVMGDRLFKYKYDELNRIKSIEKLDLVLQFKYNSSGVLYKIEGISNGESTIYDFDYIKHDEQGRITEQADRNIGIHRLYSDTRIDTKIIRGEETRTIVQKHDSEFNLKEAIFSSPDDNTRMTFLFNENNLVSSIDIDGDVVLVSYSYDSHGNWLKRIMTDKKNKSGMTFVTERKISYY